MSVGGKEILAESSPARQTPFCRSWRRSLRAKASPAESELLHVRCTLEQARCEEHRLQLLLDRYS